MAAGEAAAPVRPATIGAAGDTTQAGPGTQLPSWQQNQTSAGPYVSYGGPTYASSQQGVMRPRSPPRRDWRDYFVSLIPARRATGDGFYRPGAPSQARG